MNDRSLKLALVAVVLTTVVLLGVAVGCASRPTASLSTTWFTNVSSSVMWSNDVTPVEFGFRHDGVVVWRESK